jgi:hypothetical protein
LPTVTYRGPIYPADATVALSEITADLTEGSTLEIKSKLYIAGIWEIPRNINIRCHSEIVLASGNGTYIRFGHEQYLAASVSGTTLSSLPARGARQLAWTTPPVSGASGHFLHLRSTEDLITRVGSPGYTPYKKIETFAAVRDNWVLRSPTNISYVTAAALTIEVYRKGVPVTIEGLRISVEYDAGATEKSMCLHVYGRSNITFVNCQIDRRGTELPGASWAVSRCYALRYNNVLIIGGQSDAGDSYGFTHEGCDDIIATACGYVDSGGAAKTERGWTGRHNSNVTIRDPRFNGIDDHWAYNYLIDNAVLPTRPVSIAGGSVTITNSCNLGNVLFWLRGDTPYADGRLTIKNSWSTGLLIGSERESDARATRRKVFDEIIVRDSYVKGNTSLMIVSGIGVSGDTVTKTRRIFMDNVAITERPFNASSLYLIVAPRIAQVAEIRRWRLRDEPSDVPPWPGFSGEIADVLIVDDNPDSDRAIGTVQPATALTNPAHYINLRSGKHPGMRVWDSTNNRPVFAKGGGAGEPWVDGQGAAVHTPTLPLIRDSSDMTAWDISIVAAPNTITRDGSGVHISISSSGVAGSLRILNELTIGKWYRFEIDVSAVTGVGLYTQSLATYQGGGVVGAFVNRTGTFILEGYARVTVLNLVPAGEPSRTANPPTALLHWVDYYYGKD